MIDSIDLKNCKKFIINLEERKDRLLETTTILNDTNYKNVQRFNAIKLTDIEEIRKYVKPEAMQPIINNKRKDHHELSKGAVGCYLSHLEIYKMLRDSSDDYYCIFEDDVKTSMDVSELTDKIKGVPDDWDIILIHSYYNDREPINDEIAKTKTFVLFHSYIIRRKNINTIIDTALPMDKQLDWYISSLAQQNKINIYGVLNNDKWETNHKVSNSDIQTGFEAFQNKNNKNKCISYKEYILLISLLIICICILLYMIYILFYKKTNKNWNIFKYKK